MREVVFVGTARADLRAFPAAARNRVGLALWRVQLGEEPPDWKSMPRVGPGCREIRVRDADSNAFRVIYVCAIADVVWVLHCFEKKTQRTAKADVALASARYRAAMVAAREERS